MKFLLVFLLHIAVCVILLDLSLGKSVGPQWNKIIYDAYYKYDTAQNRSPTKLQKRPNLLCSFCKIGIDMVKLYMVMGKTRNQAANMITTSCTKLGIQHKRVCYGIVNMFKDDFFTIFAGRKIRLSSKATCAILIGDICGSVLPLYKPWNITIRNQRKPRVQNIRDPKASNDAFI